MLRSRRRSALRAALGISAGAFALLIVSASAFGAVRRVPQKYPTIQAAVDAANPGDTIAVAKKRNFEGVTVNTERLAIKGVKPGVVVDGYIEGSGDTYQFQIVADRVRLVNLELRNGHGVDCGSSDRCVANKLRFTGASAGDCFSSTGNGVRVLNSRLTACDGYGINIAGENARVINTHVRMAGRKCIAITGDDAVIRNSSARGCEDGEAIGINGDRGLVRGNKVARADSELIYVSGNRARVLKNKGSGAYYECVYATGDRIRIRGNRLTNCEDGGIHVDGEQPKVINNRLKPNDDSGVSFSCTAVCGKALLKGNVVRGQFNGADGYYVTTSSGTGRLVVRDNAVVDAAGNGFYLGLDHGRVIGNVVRTSGYQHESGFHVNGDGNLLRANRALGNGGDGFEISGGENRLERNVARKNHGDGFEVGVFSGNALIGNVATANKADGFENNGTDTALRRNRASGNRRDCANDGTIAVKRKNRCADRSNFNEPSTASRVRGKGRAGS